jgi:hypothetical protein
LLVEKNNARIWHMSDAEPSADTAARILSDRGPVDVVSTKFQPADPQLNYQHNMGSSFDRRAVASWLETACACAPKLAFPYASGLCFQGVTAWLNRYAYPFSVEHVVDLLAQRLAGVGSACIAAPGDVISIRDGRLDIEKQASAFVRQVAPEACIKWEPFDDEHLRGLPSPGERRAFEEEIAGILLGGEFAAWIEKRSTGESALLKAFRDWRVVCQFVVHMGAGMRSYFQVDFTTWPPRIQREQTVKANYFTHIGAEAAQRLFAGKTSSLEVMIGGSAHIYERIISLRDGHLHAPATSRLYEEFPDPLISFGGARRRSS